MTKRLIELDDGLLAEVQRQLGTTGVTDTVRTALVQISASLARARQVAWLSEGGLAEMIEPDQRAEVWR
jgi:Arc/MetJ family transcription regulator